ncbi:calcineurin-like phosphoesterase C-terminal domain-containing protein [Pedobacter metabolipauper]|uniref:Calcineurin-like phosphoesterase family protein n=1 Tax=Pedobacter metabolipauper TaxID=425513 RepID=A0A4R6SZM6_9SPHI|nr:calcineurin-like phosphoesterase family protein [Pedobacter metabolipauper]TDQ11515.1 calcineurin-like phosphoesterase family protein [Pedobacter metabolipauper]
MIKKLLWVVLLLLVQSKLYAQEKAIGIVYEDKNVNNIKDKAEGGIKGVAVSNGSEVVLTDERGRYELPIGKDDIIFVIKPSGYQVGLNADNLPQSYYIHKPLGSPKSKFKGVAPTGKLPKSINFALHKQVENDDFKILVMGDPQVLDKRELEYYNKSILSEAAQVKDIAFGISLGDMVQEDLGLNGDYKKLTSNLHVPWYNVLGNHDMNTDSGIDSLHDETFEADFGPASYSFNYGKAHFIILDNNVFPDPRGGKGLWAGYTKKQFRFIENDLKQVKKDQLVIIANHIQMNIVNENSFRKEDRQQLFNLFKGYTNVLVLSAHTHNNQQFFYTKEDGWPNETRLHEYNVGAACGNWYSGKINERGVAESTMSDGTPVGFVTMQISGNKYKADYKVSGKPEDYQIGLFHRKVMATIWWEGRGRLYANFFMGHKGSKVEYRIDNENWKPMRYIVEPDPAYIAELYRWDTADILFPGRRPTEPANCTHLWWAQLTNDRPLGTHSIEVRAKDDYGQTFVQKSSFRIEESKYK